MFESVNETISGLEVGDVTQCMRMCLSVQLNCLQFDVVVVYWHSGFIAVVDTLHNQLLLFISQCASAVTPMIEQCSLQSVTVSSTILFGFSESPQSKTEHSLWQSVLTAER